MRRMFYSTRGQTYVDSPPGTVTMIQARKKYFVLPKLKGIKVPNLFFSISRLLPLSQAIEWPVITWALLSIVGCRFIALLSCTVSINSHLRFSAKVLSLTSCLFYSTNRLTTCKVAAFDTLSVLFCLFRSRYAGKHLFENIYFILFIDTWEQMIFGFFLKSIIKYMTELSMSRSAMHEN